MGATEEHIQLLASLGVTHVSYILLLFSAAFLLFLFVHVLVHVYAQAMLPLDQDDNDDDERSELSDLSLGLNKRSDAREGGIKLPPTPVVSQRRRRDLERARQAEEFELEGLIGENGVEEEPGEGSSRDGDGGASEDSGSGRRKENGRVK